jgi:hypothetical protein
MDVDVDSPAAAEQIRIWACGTQLWTGRRLDKACRVVSDTGEDTILVCYSSSSRTCPVMRSKCTDLNPSQRDDIKKRKKSAVVQEQRRAKRLKGTKDSSRDVREWTDSSLFLLGTIEGTYQNPTYVVMYTYFEENGKSRFWSYYGQWPISGVALSTCFLRNPTSCQATSCP